MADMIEEVDALWDGDALFEPDLPHDSSSTCDDSSSSEPPHPYKLHPDEPQSPLNATTPTPRRLLRSLKKLLSKAKATALSPLISCLR